MFRVLEWAGGHRTAVSWALALITTLAMAGGAVAGSLQPSVPAPVAGMSGTAAAERAPAPARIITVTGVVVGVRAQGFALRTSDGRIVVVRTDEHTRYRRKGEPLAREALRRGHTLTAIGRLQPNGVLRARAVSVRGAPQPLPPLPNTPSVPLY
jgi:hypothetical protein